MSYVTGIFLDSFIGMIQSTWNRTYTWLNIFQAIFEFTQFVGLTIIRECFHLVSLFNTLNKLMQENMFLQQYGDVSPISKVSAVNSGCSPMTQEGKSNKAMLK